MFASLQFTSARTEDLDPRERAEIIQVCIAAHQQDSFQNLFVYVPSGGWHFLARLDGRLLAHAMVTTRWLQPAGMPLLKTAYVDAVATLPSVQGQGIGSTLMRKLAAEIAADFLVACLETDRPGFYTRLGWQPWRGPLAGRGKAGLVPPPDQQGILVLALPQAPELNLDDALTIECQAGRIW